MVENYGWMGKYVKYRLTGSAVNPHKWLGKTLQNHGEREDQEKFRRMSGEDQAKVRRRVCNQLKIKSINNQKIDLFLVHWVAMHL
jgi:hypothetical protein